MVLPQILFASLIGMAFCFPTFASGDTLIPSEVEALKQIATTLGKKTDWNFNVDPCSRQKGWIGTVETQEKGYENNVTCSCVISNDSMCHVVSIKLKSQSLPGKLPPELVNLPYLQEIDLSRNYLNGTIPSQWSSLPLVAISLLGNRLTGSIPEEFGNISTLTSLVVEFNNLSGTIPASLGNLSQIERLFLTSNNFTGELPLTLAKLTTLKDVRIGDNRFTGKIPDFIRNWTSLTKLVIQGSGFDGPIPPGIAFLTSMTDLRISDLNGNYTTFAIFPPLENMTSLSTLILRSCNINGSLPDLGKMTAHLKKVLDLSFNNLSGEIPSSYYGLTTDNIYLTGNLLNGSAPTWTPKRDQYIDLSYNNFSSELTDCAPNNVNLFGISSKGNTSGIVSCLGSSPCQKSSLHFHINCGGPKVKINGSTYEDDANSGGPSTFFSSSGSNWGFSSTGHFLNDERPTESFTWENESTLSVNDPKLYMNARLSAISLTYYGRCLKNGNYTVKLHFAEIMFTGGNTFKSLGRRMFHIYIQGEPVQKDFNIVDEAGGVGKEIVKNFAALVTNSTLEIRLYWAGKGTIAMPYGGVYGPLISAISAEHPEYVPQNGSSISAGVVAGIVVAVVFVIIVLLGILWWRGCLPFKDDLDQDLKGLDLQTGSFTLRQIKAATNNFDATNKIGEGGFGPVYKGLLLDGTVIAVKQLSSKSKQGNREFVNEIGMISALQHPHLVKLYGCCIEGNQLLLVYEYMENNSLARALFGPEEFRLTLDWPTRYKICIGIARGLAYLHEESRLKIVHRDIKATNVLLDKNLNPKISDFGLAKLDEEENTHISTRIAGTYGYMAPEYAMRGYLTDKADVYSFGIVALEIVSRRTNTSYKPKEDSFYLLDWALVLKERGNLMELVDPSLGSDFNKKEVMVMINIALRCTNVSPAVRPTMSSVVSMLESRTLNEVLVSDLPGSSDEMMEMKGTMIEMQRVPETKMSDSLIQSVSTDGPWTASSTSTSDLYPVILNSDYLADRR